MAASLGVVHGRTGRQDEAIDLLRLALAIAQEFDDRRREAEILTELAEVSRRLGRHRDALDQLYRARDVAQEIGEPLVAMAVRNGLGVAEGAMRNPSAGLAQHRSALAMARRIRDRYQLAPGLDGIAHALHDTGRRRPTRRHWRDALAVFADLGVPEAEEVRTRLRPTPPE